MLGDSDTYNLYYKTMKIVELASTLEVYEKIRSIQHDSIVELFTLFKDIISDNDKEKIGKGKQEPIKKATVKEIE